MTDVGEPTLPPQGPQFRSKSTNVDAFFEPGLALAAIGRIDTIVFTDAIGNLYFPSAPGINKEVDLPLEENASVSTTCP
jgi:hypothetical protein